MKETKKIISLVLALAMVATMAVALTGCGGESTAKNDGVFTVYGFGAAPAGKA